MIIKSFFLFFNLLFFINFSLALGAVIDPVRSKTSQISLEVGNKIMEASADAQARRTSNGVEVNNLESSKLKELMDQKSAALQELSNQRQEVEKNLDEIEGKGQNLKRDLKKIDYQINQLNLNIKAGEINLEKFDLEIESINLDIQNIEKNINNGKNAIASALRNVQQKEGENFLVFILRNKSLAAGVSEAKALLDFNSALAAQIGLLRNFHSDFILKAGEVSQKKIKKEAENRRLKDRQLIAIDQKDSRQDLLTQTKNQEKIYQQQLDELEKKQAEIAAEVDLIETELRAKLDPSLLPLPRPGVFNLPVEGEKWITQKFGQVSRLYGGKPHNGLDLRAIIGAPILAAEKGKVIMATNQDKFCRRGAYGKVVVIEHDNNLTTLYAHLSRYDVKEGDLVGRGDLIGYAGKTGYATGPHLHFGVYASQTVSIRPSRICGPMPFGAPLDPADYL